MNLSLCEVLKLVGEIAPLLLSLKLLQLTEDAVVSLTHLPLTMPLM